jgi:hypothetical protein
MSYQGARELVDDAVARHIEAWAKIIELASTSPQFVPFRRDVTEALHACIDAHIADALFPKFSRISDLRKHRKKMVAEAKGLARRLRNFNKKYSFPTMVVHIGRTFDLVAPAEDLEALASLWEEDPAKAIDRGGPSRMQAFRMLAQRLACAFQRAAGHSASVTWNNYDECYEGRFFRLVQAVLSVACEVAKVATTRSLSVPKSPTALGKYLQRLQQQHST